MKRPWKVWFGCGYVMVFKLLSLGTTSGVRFNNFRFSYPLVSQQSVSVQSTSTSCGVRNDYDICTAIVTPEELNRVYCCKGAPR